MKYGKMAKCQEYNEQLIAKLYLLVADKIDDPIIKGAFFFIALDSQKHALVFRELSEEYDVGDFDPEECSTISGAAYGMRGLLMEAHEKIKQADNISQILGIMEHIESIEATLGELDRNVLTEGIIDKDKKELYKILLNYIEEDEHKHEKIIREIIQNFKDLRK